MSATKSKVRYWTCPKCKTRNERTKQVCRGTIYSHGGHNATPCGGRRPKPRVPAHRRTLQDDPYATYEALNREIHGAEPDACGVCGRPPKHERRHDRDHDHTTGKPRGLACPGNQGCNALMPRWLTADRAQAIADYLRRVEEHYGPEA